MLRRTIDFNHGWRFRKDEAISAACRVHGLPDVPNPEPRQWQKAGWHSISKPDNPHPGDWRSVDLPHDFLIEGEFRSDAPGKTGNIPYGKAWYVKDFELSAEEEGKRIAIEFDGIYRDSQIYVNGHFIGRRMSGFISASYDISEVCNYGESNRIAVFADATETEQWSYQGGGIYRAVRMLITDAVHVDYRGLDIRPRNDGAIELDVTVVNDSYETASCTVEARVLGTDASGSGQTRVEVHEKAVTSVELNVEAPKLWSVDEPNLYTIQVTVTTQDGVADCYEEHFGFREIEFSATEGFLLNSRQLKIKGVCCHQDYAGVGVAVPPELHEWRLLRLKSMGCNAIRTSHNMPDPAFLDACDKHGMLVMEEARLPGCAEELLRDLADTVIRDRNRPSVIMWSLSNEEPISTTPVGARVFKRMRQLVRKLDPTRPTTCAIVGDWFETAKFSEENDYRLDVFGMNYGHHENGARYDRFHKEYPDWPYFASESWGGFTSRGVYAPGPAEVNPDYGKHHTMYESEAYAGFVSAYGTTFAGYGVHLEACWRLCAERPEMAGTFLWTGFDYRGETTPYLWPAVISHFGMLDYCGYEKELAHYLRCWWRPDDPHTFLMPHWNWHGREGEAIRVRCYSNAAEVELRLNDRSIARQAMAENDKLEWQVPYEPGVLEAIGYNANGQEVSQARNATAAAPAKLALSSTVIGDLAVIDVEVQDKHGTLCPDADNRIEFEVSANAEILGVGNGNPYSHEPDRFTNTRKAYLGLCQVIVRRTAPDAGITVAAQSRLLSEASVVCAASGTNDS